MDFDHNYSPSAELQNPPMIVRDKKQFKDEIDQFLGAENSDSSDSSAENDSSDEAKDYKDQEMVSPVKQRIP